jgi:hypothetical protein
MISHASNHGFRLVGMVALATAAGRASRFTLANDEPDDAGSLAANSKLPGCATSA